MVAAEWVGDVGGVTSTACSAACTGQPCKSELIQVECLEISPDAADLACMPVHMPAATL